MDLRCAETYHLGMPIRVELADHHAILRQDLRAILESHPDLIVVAEAGTGPEAAEMARRLRPDVAIVDIDMGGGRGLEAAAQILAQAPRTAVLILSMHADPRYVSRAAQTGARGYLVKDALEQELAGAVRQVVEGKTFVLILAAEQSQPGETGAASTATPEPAARDGRGGGQV